MELGGCLLPGEREPCLLRGLTFSARLAPSSPGWGTQVDRVSVMRCAGAGWSRGMAFRVGPRLRRTSRSLAPAQTTFQRQRHRDARGERSWFSQPCSFCVVKTPCSHLGAAVQGFLVFPTHQLLPKTSQLGSPGVFSHCWLFMSPSSGCEIPRIVLSCSHMQADGFVSPQPLWEPVPPIPSSPGLSGHNLGEKPDTEGTRLTPTLAASLDPPMSRSRSVSSHSGLKNACPCCHHHLCLLQASTAPWQAAACCASAKAAWCRSWLPAALPFPVRTAEARPRPRSAPLGAGWKPFPAAAEDAQPLPLLSAPFPSPPSHQHLLPRSPIPVGATLGVTAVTPAQPLRDTGHPGTAWLWVLHAKRRGKFLLSGKLGTQVWFCEGRAGGKASPSLSHWHRSAGGSGATQLCGRQSLSRRPHLPVPAAPLPRPSRGWEMGSSTHRPPVPCSVAAPCSATFANTGMLLLTSKSTAWGAGGPQVPFSEALSPPDPDRATPAVHRPLQTQILVGNLYFYPLQALFPPALPSSLLGQPAVGKH